MELSKFGLFELFQLVSKSIKLLICDIDFLDSLHELHPSAQVGPFAEIIIQKHKELNLIKRRQIRQTWEFAHNVIRLGQNPINVFQVKLHFFECLFRVEGWIHSVKSWCEKGVKDKVGAFSCA